MKGIDDAIHQKNRLGIMAHLAAVGESDFLALKKAVDLSDGNLSMHAAVLEKAGYIEIEKSFVGKKTRTTYSITKAGRKAFLDYICALQSIFRGEL